MVRKLSAARIGMLMLWLSIAAGCADQYVVYHEFTGDPLILTRRGYSQEACLEQIRQDANELGVTFRYVHMKGSLFGQSLLWPFRAGYFCEAAVNPTDKRRGIYSRQQRQELTQLQ